jgi:membrane fusion protein (multidrug efflux system)
MLVPCLCLLFAGCAREPGRGGAPAAAPVPVVYVAEVQRQDLALYSESLAELSGYVDAEIRARVRGFLKAQHYADGTEVKSGQLLFSIDPREYENAVAAANAQLARARAAASRNRVLLERSQGLYQTGMVSQQGLDDARTSVADTGAQVEAAQAQLEQAKLNLSYTRIHSPIDGIAGLALVRVGNLVGQDGPTLLTTASQLDPIRVSFTLSEVDYVKDPTRFHSKEVRDLAWAKRQFEQLAAKGTTDSGDSGVELLLADGSAYPQRGVIITTDRQIDAKTGTIRLQAFVPNADGVLRPGQYGRVRIRRADDGKNVVTVPEKALVMVQNTYSVAVVGEGDTIKLQRVRLGSGAGGRRVVEEGLQGGERIVVEGVQKVSDGARVSAAKQP